MSSSVFAGRKSVTMAAAAAAAVLLSNLPAYAAFDVVEKTIPQLESAYAAGTTTVKEVVENYIIRINTYDDGPNGVNAVGQLNPNREADIAAVQALINGGATTAQYPLLGVPILIKDSYDVKGMITTNGVSILNGVGTPGSTTMVAPNDAPNIAALKAAGAIILGKANMSTMAYSFNGIDNAHGVVRNPYNYNRQPGGSSSGSGAAAASNFAMLTMGGETGGSIRVPSTYNALVGLKTSAGLINPGGTWPLTPARDVVGPMGKSVADVAYAMNALVKPSTGNLFSNTPFYPAGGAQPGAVGSGLGEGTDPTSAGLTIGGTGTRPNDYTAFLNPNALRGKTLAVPNSVNGVGTQYDGTINPYVKTNFQRAIKILQAQGATIKYVDVPSQQLYFSTLGRTGSGGATTVGLVDKAGNPIPYPTTTVGGTTPASTFNNYAAAFYYEKQIESYGNPTIKNLRDFATALRNGANFAAGSPFSTLGGAAGNIEALATIYEAGNAKGFGDANGDGAPDNPEAIQALAAFATIRQQYFNDFMESEGIDAFIAPTMGNLAPMQGNGLRDTGVSGTDPYAGGSASLIGRFDGNILGLPALTVPMGSIDPDPNVWTGLQFFSQFDSEAKLLGYGYAFEQATKFRTAPDLTRFIPEPATFAVLMVGSGLLLGRRRMAQTAS